MTDLEKRVREALDNLAGRHGRTADIESEPVRRTTRQAPARREPRPAPQQAPQPSKVWSRSSDASRDIEARFADAPDSTRQGKTVRVFVYEVEPINGAPYATVIRQDNRQRFTVPIGELTNIGDNA
jgi:hypothetical protein